MHLLQSSAVQFSLPGHRDPFSGMSFLGSRSNPELYTRTATVSVNPLSTDRDATLNNALTKFSNLRPRDKKLWNISIEVGAGASVRVRDGFHYEEVYGGSVSEDIYENGGYVIRVRDTYPGGVFENLNNYFGGNLKVKVQILNLRDNFSRGYTGYSREPATGINLETTEEKVARSSTNGTYGYEVSMGSDSFNDIRTRWHQGMSAFLGTIIITVTLPDHGHDTSIQDVLCINRKMLKDEVACDVSIISKNGAAIKCHKNFLCAHSAVLEAMFQTKMKESKTNTVEMPDMTEESVRAFLQYLYLWEVKEANKSSLIAFELLHAGHKYDIQKLEECMEKILLSKESPWYKVDVAMKLFLFARNRPEGAELKIKAIQVLKARFAELEKSRSYQQLFQKDPKAAMELCKYAFSA